ncbi:MAG: LysM peptidoglycan-binding domain-containing protein [Clostridium sp.]
MKKNFIFLALLSVLVISGCLGNDLKQAMAEESSSQYQKYYTSIRLEEGDTLWNIADRYRANSGKSREEYVRELRFMNSLIDDTIHTGNYLTVSYYEPVKGQ